MTFKKLATSDQIIMVAQVQIFSKNRGGHRKQFHEFHDFMCDFMTFHDSLRCFVFVPVACHIPSVNSHFKRPR
jgi:hypothetical protein